MNTYDMNAVRSAAEVSPYRALSMDDRVRVKKAEEEKWVAERFLDSLTEP